MLDAVTTILAVTEAAGEEESSSFIVSPNVGLMIWTLLAFFVTLYILNKKAFPRIKEVIDQRREATEQAVAHAEQTRQEADKLLEEYRQRLAEARDQAEEIVLRARKAAEQREVEAKQLGAKEREELLEQTKREIELETQRALQDLRREVASLTVVATEKVTRKVLDPADQERLVEDALKEVDFSALAGGANKN